VIEDSRKEAFVPITTMKLPTYFSLILLSTETTTAIDAAYMHKLTLEEAQKLTTIGSKGIGGHAKTHLGI